jgi:hypothetical protein
MGCAVCTVAAKPENEEPVGHLSPNGAIMCHGWSFQGTDLGRPLEYGNDRILYREDLASDLGDLLKNLFINSACPEAINNGTTHPSTFKFQCREIPQFDIRLYLSRLLKYIDFSGETMLITLVYLARIQRTHPSFPINVRTIHRLMLVGLLVSSKFFDDSFASNTRYAHIGGISLAEMNMLEFEFLFALTGFNLTVTKQEYSQVYSAVVHRAKIDFLFHPTPYAAAPPAQQPMIGNHNNADNLNSSFHRSSSIVSKPS